MTNTGVQTPDAVTMDDFRFSSADVDRRLEMQVMVLLGDEIHCCLGTVLYFGLMPILRLRDLTLEELGAPR